MGPAPLFPRRGPSGRFPHFTGRIEELRLLSSRPGPASVVPRRPVLPPRSSIRSVREASAPLGGLGCFHRGPRPGLRGRGVEASQVPGGPLPPRRALRPRSGLGVSPCRPLGAASAQRDGAGPNDGNSFEAQSHGLWACCLRFASDVTAVHARLASGCWLGFAGRALPPAGSLCKVSVADFLLTQACLAHPVSRFPFPVACWAVSGPSARQTVRCPD
jgi:hypothetical protein